MMRAQMNIIWDSIACPIHYLSLPNGEVVYSESLGWTSIEEYKNRLTNITIQKNEILGAYDIFDNTGTLITRRKNKNEAEQYVSDINNVETKSTCGVPTTPLFILHMDRIKFPTSKCTCETDTAYFSFIQISSRPYRMGYILLINDVQHFYEIYPKDPAKNPFAHCWYKVYLPSSDIYAKEMFTEEQLRRCWLVKEVKKRPFYKVEIRFHPFGIDLSESWKCVTKMTDSIDIEEKMAKENIRKIINGLNDKHCIVASRYPMMIDVKITEDE